MKTALKYYVGINVKTDRRQVFSVHGKPTARLHGKHFSAAIGPFTNLRAALYVRDRGFNNPQIRCPADAEKLCRVRSGPTYQRTAARLKRGRGQRSEVRSQKRRRKNPAGAIRIGDRVKCIDASASFGRLTKGAIYKVEAAHDGTPTVISNRANHSIDRFVKVPSRRRNPVGADNPSGSPAHRSRAFDAPYETATPRNGKANGQRNGRGGTSTSTATSTDVRSPTSTETSTKAHTARNVTVTGGAGRGANTTVHIRNPRRRKNPVSKLRAGERQGDIFARVKEPFRLAGERGTDHARHQAERQAKAKAARDFATRRQLDFETNPRRRRKR